MRRRQINNSNGETDARPVIIDCNFKCAWTPTHDERFVLFFNAPFRGGETVQIMIMGANGGSDNPQNCGTIEILWSRNPEITLSTG